MSQGSVSQAVVLWLILVENLVMQLKTGIALLHLQNGATISDYKTFDRGRDDCSNLNRTRRLRHARSTGRQEGRQGENVSTTLQLCVGRGDEQRTA